ncbi:MAG: class I SAM-dependent methyltransferase [Bryobacterales bacterium]|nr:class I SAM-dependent methyltransferase [Bryobacteraceae bacterium]MDW8129224.1 class I SAM-dependent methyltransferase [Bryobacterales bacterium]
MSRLPIYDQRYAAVYERLYVEAWPYKHRRNQARIAQLAEELAGRGERLRWLDVACGPAWHFRGLPEGISRFGLDASTAQLDHARKRSPQAAFVCADMTEPVFRPASFDLVTSFWAAYCYLDSFARIAAWLDNLVGWVRPGGACYFEVLLPADVATFNRSPYAAATGFRVFPRSPDWVRWGYRDAGGLHNMTSPPLGFFTAPLVLAFERVEAEHDGAFMVHVVGHGRK